MCIIQLDDLGNVNLAPETLINHCCRSGSGYRKRFHFFICICYKPNTVDQPGIAKGLGIAVSNYLATGGVSYNKVLGIEHVDHIHVASRQLMSNQFVVPMQFRCMVSPNAMMII